MLKTAFSKPASTPEQLISKLKAQGLVIPSTEETQALNYLKFADASNLVHYRLK
jgi:hypothetical protein